MPPPPASSTSSAPLIFDVHLLRQRKRRALAAASKPGARDGSFLRDQTAQDVLERLDAVERQFDHVLDLSDDDGKVAELLMQNPRVGRLTRLVSDESFMSTGQVPTSVGTQEHLPAASESLNLVTSVLGLQWVNDLPGTMVQVRRALKPDGLFLGALVGGNTLHELRDVLAAEEDEATGGASPRVIPFVDVRDLGSLLQRAGFALPVTDVDTFTVRYGNLFVLMADLRAMGATNPLVHRSRKPWTKTRAVRAAQLYAERYADADGRIRATFQILSFSGWAPSDVQQQPLRPGSAKSRLADALDASEHSTGEKPPS
ncbi:MAG: methyltransferase domain-containing protein [Pseudomonadota bacterium]